MDDEDDYPVLTDMLCPGDRLRPQGLWLPLAPEYRPAPTIPADPEWRDGIPPALRPRADDMVDAVKREIRARARASDDPDRT